MKLLKIAIGSAIAILLADYIGLQNSTAAGIITLLTIQDTKKETIKITFQRILVFVIATALAFLLFNLIGYHAITFGIFLLVFVGCCYFFHLTDSIAMNAVLTTHYLVAKNMGQPLIINELLLLVVGAGIGTLLNLYMPNDLKKIRNIQSSLETDLRNILEEIASLLNSDIKVDSSTFPFSIIDKHIETGLAYAYSNMNNRFIQETWYFISYMEMRKQQCQVLRNIYEKIASLKFSPYQAKEISYFVQHIALSLHETNNAEDLLEEGQSLYGVFQQSALPISRDEFEARAILYMIMKDLDYFLEIKIAFSNSLTEKQINMYWVIPKKESL
ncbi:MAG TPA: aromatic acid exporter family protein [Lachnospiraceae bacterium]|nr:aromatic acid exporter family protein [Lachnospiraceae bacterium]